MQSTSLGQLENSLLAELPALSQSCLRTDSVQLVNHHCYSTTTMEAKRNGDSFIPLQRPGRAHFDEVAMELQLVELRVLRFIVRLVALIARSIVLAAIVIPTDGVRQEAAILLI